MVFDFACLKCLFILTEHTFLSFSANKLVVLPPNMSDCNTSPLKQVIAPSIIKGAMVRYTAFLDGIYRIGESRKLFFFLLPALNMA
jgi:hypothetical protein